MMYKHVSRVIFMKKLFIKFFKIINWILQRNLDFVSYVLFFSKKKKKNCSWYNATKIERKLRNRIVENIFRSLSCYVVANQVLTAKLLPNDENDSRLMSQTHSRRSHNSRKHCNHYFLHAQRLSSIRWSNVLVNSLGCWKYYYEYIIRYYYLNFLDLHWINFMILFENVNCFLQLYL